MNKEIVDSVDSVLAKLDALAVKLGMTVEQVWPWLVRQQYVNAVYSLILFVFFSLIGYVSYRFIRKIDWGGDEFTSEQGVGVTIGVISGFGFTISFIYFLNQFPDIFNPEYWALKDLIRIIR